VLVSIVVLGPALRPGYLLHEDLVAVPRPVLNSDAIGLGDRLPRAVPWDSLVAVTARVIPDDLTVQVLALIALAAAGAGAARLARPAGPGRWIALLVAIWNPFVAEQLGIGHVPHLLGYGALPWVAVGVTGVLAGRPRSWPGLAAACVLGSSTPGGGLLCLGTALAAGVAAQAGTAGHGRRTRALLAAGTATLAQAPWVLAGLSHPAGLRPAAGATAFATRQETFLGVVPDVLGLGGMWASGTLPVSRRTWLAVASTVLLLGLAGLGRRPLLAATVARRRQLVAGAILVTVGYGIALLPHLPGGRGALDLAADHVPAGGLLRDGHRWLAWPALGLAVLAGFGATAVVRGLADRTSPGFSRVAAAPALVVVASLLVAVLPDLALGVDGDLVPRAYPADWKRVRAVLDAAPDHDRILVLPWQPFRLFPWSGPVPVLDPAPRLLPRPVLVDDALTVSGVTLPAEGAASRAIGSALSRGRLTAGELRALGVGWILVEHGTAGLLPELPPTAPVVQGSDLLLLRAGPAQPTAMDRWRQVAVMAGQLVYAALASAAAASFVAGGIRSRVQPRS
jgi:hypothetical protein